MYLKRVVMHGFKSFADKTVVDLDRGVTAIVGPNGCGKSNIADAIKWVLGEQSPKSLRATSMQDVLFEGADTRPAMAFCEVGLLFSDCTKELGTAFEEVEVSRRVERDGGSRYAINGKSCRLRDIQNLFRDTGIGRVAYSFLQQGQIDKLISANPMDRRTVFEEAAGISGFKVQRDETLKKLTQTEENLLRVGDILREVSSSMSSLKRQAAKAVRAVRLRRQSRALDLSLVAFDLNNIDEKLEEKKAIIEPAEEDVATQKTVFEEHEAILKAAEGQLTELLERQQKLSSEIFDVRSSNEEALSNAKFLELRADEALERAQTLENSIAQLTEELNTAQAQKAELESQKQSQLAEVEATQAATQKATQAHTDSQKSYDEALSEELDLKDASVEQEATVVSLRSKLSAIELEKHGLEAALAPLNSQKEGLLADQKSLEEASEQTQRTLEVTQQNRANLAASLEKLQAADQSLSSQIKELRNNFETQQHTHSQLVAERDLNEALNRKFEGFGEASKGLLQKGGFAPLVAGLDVEPSATKAVEALLSLEIDSVYPTSPVTADVLSKLQGGERVALSHWEQSAGATDPIDGLTPAIESVKSSDTYDFINARLEGCYVCADEALFAKIVQGQADFDFVAVASTSGAMIDGRGLYFASAATSSNASYLGRQARQKELASLIEENESSLHTLQDKLADLDAQLNANSSEQKQTANDLAESSAAERNLANQLKQQQENIERLGQKISALEAQSSNSVERLAQIATQRTQLEADFEAAASQKGSCDERLGELSSALSGYRSARDEAYTALSDARLAEANARHALQSIDGNLRSIDSRIAEVDARVSNDRSSVERLKNDSQDYRQQAVSHKQRSSELQERLNSLEGQLREVRQTLSTKDAAQSEQRQALDLLREDLSAAQNSLMRTQLEFNELQNRRSSIVEDFEHRYGEAEELSSLNWRALLHEADVFERADEATLEVEQIELPEAAELEAKYPRLDRNRLFSQTQKIRRSLDSLGPINENALEDYTAQQDRYEGLKAQVEDLSAAKDELAAALASLNEQSSTLFVDTFKTIRAHFAKTFEKLFGGGKADLVLSDENDPLNCGIEIMARPPGTQLKSLNLLSGGQKTMTAVALLFSIYQVKPSPFCVLDELDAPLDDANIGRFLLTLKSFTAFSQFLIITHNKATMAASNVLYGVTMQERGVSRMLSMRLQEASEFSMPSPAVEEPAAEEEEDAQKIVDAAKSNAQEKASTADCVEPTAKDSERPNDAEVAVVAAALASNDAQEIAPSQDDSAADASAEVDDDEALRAAVKAQSFKLRELEQTVELDEQTREIPEDEEATQPVGARE